MYYGKHERLIVKSAVFIFSVFSLQKGFRHFLYCMMIACLQCADRGAEYFRHILIFHLVVISHVEHETLLLRQFRYRLLQLFLQFVTIEIIIGFQIIDKKRLIRILTEI